MDEMARMYRSNIYVVGHRERHIEKAYASDVDCVVLELEDAVAPSMKEAARAMVRDVLSTPPPKPTYVRVNPLGSGLTYDDIAAVADTAIDGIRLAKAQSSADVLVVAGWLAELGSSAAIQVLLETAGAVERAPEIAAAHPRVVGVSLGEQDLQADIGASDEGLLYARSKVIFAARAAGLPAPWQSVWTDIRDLAGLRESTLRGKRLGFFGRSAIHPDQVPIINEVFTPTRDEIEQAEELQQQLDDAVDAGSAGLKLADGRFIDNAIVLAAKRTLAFGRLDADRPIPDQTIEGAKP